MTDTMTLPDFRLDSSNGEIQLNQLTGWVILYFYPKDSTPGCTTQANEFTQLNDQFAALNTQILGVSRDSIKSHERFIEKQNINFTLISDPEEKLCQYFDVIKEKNMYGKKVMGVERSSFIFHDGKLLASFRKVKAAGHAEQMLNEIRKLQQET